LKNPQFFRQALKSISEGIHQYLGPFKNNLQILLSAIISKLPVKIWPNSELQNLEVLQSQVVGVLD
jgi:hypothetical protein